MDNYGFLKVAAAIPSVKVADCAYNASQIIARAEEAAGRGVEVVLFPESAVTGATAGDLRRQPMLLRGVTEALQQIRKASRKIPLVMIVGAPLRRNDRLYNCAVLIADGRIQGVVPQSHLSDDGRWDSRLFTPGVETTGRISIDGEESLFGSDLIFMINGVEIGIEFGTDLDAVIPPSSLQCANGAKVIFSLAARSAGVNRLERLERRIAEQSSRTCSAYVYASAGDGESSTDEVFAGEAFIAEEGEILSRARRFAIGGELVVADVDIERVEFARSRTTHTQIPEGNFRHIKIEAPLPLNAAALERRVDPMPFVPADREKCNARCEEIFAIQAHGLMQRLRHTHSRSAVIGISGGLDSTLALLVAVRAFDLMEMDRRQIIGVTMPGFGTTGRTYDNALKMMQGLGITVREIPIRKACEQHFADIGLPEGDHSAAFENGQARERTQILMDVANMEGGLVVGTGDLSELALGWATYNGDQMSMYGVNASIPKTLVRHLVRRAAELEPSEEIRLTLLDVVDTPVSPELLPADARGDIAQKTEDLVGPYELHDFFLHNFLGRGYRPAKILFLAEIAFEGVYTRPTILKWLTTFFRRFFTQQFKRSALPDGAATGRISLSPRGGWLMPSDASAKVWLDELDKLK